MENASKALIMAAGILIAIMILSLAVYLVVTFGSFSANVHKQNEQNEIQAFNAQFLAYQNMDDVTIHDIVTVANYARENNAKYELNPSNRDNKNTYYVSVKIGNNDYVEAFNKNSLDEKIKQDLKVVQYNDGNLPTYNCVVNISEVTGRVYNVSFTLKM